MSVGAEIGIIVLLTLLNGVFSGAEIALLSVRKTRLQELADQGDRSARAALRLRTDPERLLATIQIAITVIGASTAVFGGARLEQPISHVLSLIGLDRFAKQVSFALVVAFVSYLTLVLGELVPKSIALGAPERFALMVARILATLSSVARPLVRLLTFSSNLVLKPFRDRTNFSESRLSPDEIQQLVEESAEAGVLSKGAGEIASRAIDLARLRAKALMTPRPKIVALDVETPASDLISSMRVDPHSRYPVYEDEPEKVIGYVLARDIYEMLAVTGRIALRKLLRPVAYFPESNLAIDVLRALQSSKQQLALLVDEQGGVAGLITIEDIAEDLLGEILQEHEVHKPMAWFEREDECVVALGEAPVHEVSRLLGEDLPENNATTVAGMVLEQAGRLLETGERLLVRPGIEAEVLEASPRQLIKVRLRKLPPESTAEPEA